MGKRTLWEPAVVAAVAIAVSACGGGGGSSGSSTSSVRSFSKPPVVEEVRNPEQSASPEFWLSSGARFFADDGIGRTIHGELAADDPWRQTYRRTNPRDTDDGLHPQNVFRLLTRAGYQDTSSSVVFRVNRTNLTPSPNRDRSNGVFLYNRFVSGDDFYAAGIRVDGRAVIKKKRGGRFTTLGLVDYFGDGNTYDPGTNPNLIPLGQDVTLEARLRTRPSGSVVLRLLVNGRLVLEAVDGGNSGGPTIADMGFGGIGSDFMDVQFAGFGIVPLGAE